MGKSLYRAYRSTSFDEIIGQDHITRLLKNSIQSGNISHAYLLSGPRGVGKTSVARIMAYAINDQPYQLETTNLDIIEIDAASNRRIDEIREIREKVGIAPTVGKYKIYIIDEVHMLTREAFNALLKTLEEPPAHVVFILATTETHKVPETILSRCIRLQFHPIETSVLADHLQMIAKKENITLSHTAAMIIAEHGRGSFRDAISLLEQATHTGNKIDETGVIALLGLASDKQIKRIIDAISEHSAKQIALVLTETFTQGATVEAVTAQLMDYYRNQLVSSQTDIVLDKNIINLQKQLLEVQGSPKPRLVLELCLIEFALEGKTTLPDIDQINQKSPQNKPKSSQTETTQTKNTDRKKNPIAESVVHTPVVEKSINELNNIQITDDNLVDIWDKTLDAIKKKNNTLYGIARMASVNLEGNTLILGFTFNFHIKQVNEPKNKTIILAILHKYVNQEIELTTRLIESTLQKDSDTIEKPDISNANTLQSVSNIFGGHEVLES